MSNSGRYVSALVASDVKTLTPDGGGAVLPTGLGNISIVGGTNMNTNAGANKINIHLDDNVAIAGSFDAGTSITAVTDISGRSLFATGDEGTGVGATTALTNVTNVAANSTGTFTIRSKTVNNLDSTGFIKIYIGTTVYYIPVFTTTSP